MAVVIFKKRVRIAAATTKTVLVMLRKFIIRFLIVFIYTIAGAAIFMRIETPQSIQSTKSNCDANLSLSTFINGTRQKLAMNVSAAELNQIANEMLNFASKTCDVDSSSKKMTIAQRYNMWLYFSLITIMTIGYGDVTPKTDAGKILVIIFSIIGIPLMLWLLALCGQIQTAVLRKLVEVVKNFIRRARNKVPVEVKNSDCATTVLAVLFAIVVHLIGAYFVRKRTNWSMIDCMYYWFCTVATIGYGDLTLKPRRLATVAFWLLVKLFTLAQMAGLINTVLCWIEAREFEKIKEKTKKLSRNVRKKRKYELSNGDHENGTSCKDVELEESNSKVNSSE